MRIISVASSPTICTPGSGLTGTLNSSLSRAVGKAADSRLSIGVEGTAANLVTDSVGARLLLGKAGPGHLGIEKIYAGRKRSIADLNSKLKAWHTATRACSIATAARLGGQSRNRPRTPTQPSFHRRSSTRTQPPESSSTAACASPMPSTCGCRPAATTIFSTSGYGRR